MGSPPSPLPQFPLGDLLPPDWTYQPPVYVPPWRREPITRYVVLFVLTVITTTLAGATGPVDGSIWRALLSGLWYSVPVLAILGAHEFGHYFACVYYRVNASLPYFLPMPLMLTGTLGAVIRIRQQIPGKRALFDIGIAGPLAGFAVILPILIFGMASSELVAVPPDYAGLEFGEPLLFKVAAWLTFGTLPEGTEIVMHPMLFAAWFGTLATAWNLFPIGQLDGGHIAYAVFGRKSTAITLVTVAALIGLTFMSLSWLVWSVIMIVMLFVLGPHHPRVFDEAVPLDRTRLWLAALALLVFVLCFTPTPIELHDLVSTELTNHH